MWRGYDFVLGVDGYFLDKRQLEALPFPTP